MQTQLTIHTSISTSNVPPYRLWHLTITDEPSGTVLVNLNLTAEQFLQIQGGQTTVDATLPDDLDRLGKTMHNRQTPVPREVTDGVPYAEREAAALAWARTWAAADGERTEIRHTNAGYVAIFRRWE